VNSLPEQYQRYARPAVVQPVEVELYDERRPAVREPSVWVESADDPNLMVRIPKRYVQTTPRSEPRDLTPQPLIDPLAQRLFAGGLGVGAAGAGLGFGFGQLVAGLALMGTSGLALLVGLLLAAGMRGGSVTHVRQEVHNHARWFGKTHTNL
jgi:hypothetical protein